MGTIELLYESYVDTVDRCFIETNITTARIGIAIVVDI
jgi:hypothetical protein